MIESNQGRVEVASPCHVYGTSVLSDADAAWLGTRAKIVTAGPHTLQGKEAAISAAGAQVGFYTKTAALSSGTALPEAGYAHKIGGARKFDETWNVYTAQPDSPAWQAYHLNQLMRLPAWAQTIFSDSLMLSYSQGGKAAKPPGFTRIYTIDEWLTLLSTDLEGWASATHKPFIVNGLTQSTIDNLAPGVGMIENAFGSNHGTIPTAANWLSEVAFLQTAQAAGWTPWVYVKLPTGVSRDAWRRLIVPTMLLVDEGSLLFELGGIEGAEQPWVNKEYDHPLYQPNIGMPIGSFYPVDIGAYRRDFENGFVLVNPTTLAYTSPEGAIVGPQSGGAWRKREVTTTVWDEV
jgi:hypothetical protein